MLRADGWSTARPGWRALHAEQVADAAEERGPVGPRTAYPATASARRAAARLAQPGRANQSASDAEVRGDGLDRLDADAVDRHAIGDLVPDGGQLSFTVGHGLVGSRCRIAVAGL